MSQSKVTDFYLNRKRNRMNGDDAVLNKQKKTVQLLDTPPPAANVEDKKSKAKQPVKEQTTPTSDRCLRSRNKKADAEEKPVECQQPIETEKEDKRKTRGAKQREKVEELKAKINKFEYKTGKLKSAEKDQSTAEPLSEPIQEQATAPIAAETKKETAKGGGARAAKLNREELRKRIEQFNQNLIRAQNEVQSKEAVEEAHKKESEHAKQQQEFEQRLPAHMKFEDLANEKLDHSTTLTLPKMYSILFDSFKASDTIVKFLHNRQEVCTFLKLKMGIQNLTKHTFLLKHLGQIKTVYPSAYVYKQEKMFIDFKNDYHLVIAPDLDEIQKTTGVKEFTPAVLLERLNAFKNYLLTVVKKFHQEFLQSIGIANVASENIKRWHPKFDLDNVKEIEESELPKPPVDESIKCKSGQELLNIAKDIYSSRIQDAIKSSQNELDKNQEPSVKQEDKKEVQIDLSAENTNAKENNETTKPKDPKLNALLERIRNKEKQKALETMVMNSDKEKMKTKLNNYKAAVRFLAFYFQAEKKSTIELDKVCQKMADNMKPNLNELECRELFNSMAGDEQNKSIFILNETKWLNIIKVRNTQYLQIDKTVKLNDLFSICDKQLEQLN